jgi:hypothetical protein
MNTTQTAQTIRNYGTIVNKRNGAEFSIFASEPRPAKRNKYTGQIATWSGPGELVALDGSRYYQDGDAWVSIA